MLCKEQYGAGRPRSVLAHRGDWLDKRVLKSLFRNNRDTKRIKKMGSLNAFWIVGIIINVVFTVLAIRWLLRQMSKK
jgi:hypothetical protein